MNGIDFLIVLIVILVTARGMEIGFVRQAASLGGLVVGLFASSYIASHIDGHPLISLAIISIGVLGAIIGSEYVGVKIKKTLHTSSINKVDRFFGSIAGAGIGLIFIWFCVGILPSLPSTTLRVSVRDSKIVNWLDSTLPPTTSIISWLEKSFEQTKIPEIVNELDAKISMPDTKIPDVSAFQGAIDASRDSVVKIEGRSCNGIGVGSGFVVAPNYIVTNAHVVAGMRHPYIQDENGRIRTTVAAFNPDDDVAILKTDRIEGRSLPLTQEQVTIGSQGVALGYPGGKSFTAQPGVIIDRFMAVGRDIYGEKPTKREVYALKADIEPGNSGGPFIDQNGEVLGLIFARSTTNQQVGFALSIPAIKDALSKAQAQPSDTGSLRCTS